MKRKIIFGIELVLSLCFMIAITVFAAQVGSSDDPLVAKSYVDDKIDQVLKTINGLNLNGNGSAVSTGITEADKKAIVDEVMKQVEPLIAVALTGEDAESSEAGGKYIPVFATVGQTVFGGEGTEMILRSGKGEIYINGVAGIVDATTGQELKAGTKVSMNHILIVPRDDGRGVKITENGWFIIKGDYEIK